MSRYTVALHSVSLRSPGFGGVSQDNRTTPPEKVPAAPTFRGGVALQVASWKVSRYRRAVTARLFACRAAVGHLGLRSRNSQNKYLAF